MTGVQNHKPAIGLETLLVVCIPCFMSSDLSSYSACARTISNTVSQEENLHPRLLQS